VRGITNETNYITKSTRMQESAKTDYKVTSHTLPAAWLLQFHIYIDGQS